MSEANLRDYRASVFTNFEYPSYWKLNTTSTDLFCVLSG